MAKKLAQFVFILLLVSPLLGLASTESYVVAYVNVKEGKIVSENGNNLKIEFTLFNRSGAQSGVRYGVALNKILEASDGNSTDNLSITDIYSDTTVFEDILSISEFSEIKREINYKIPDYLSGKYEVWLEVMNTSGLSLAYHKLGEVSISDRKPNIFVDQNSCYVTKGLGATEDKINSLEGVFLSPQDKLLGHCGILNNTAQKINIFVSTEVRPKTIYGELSATETKNNSITVIDPGETKEVSFDIPIVSNPQYYVAKVIFENSYDGARSNPALFTYNVEGAIINLDNLFLDKDFYKKGDTSKVTFYWTPIPGLNPASLSQSESIINIMSSSKDKCSEEKISKIENTNGGLVESEIEILADCNNPTVSLAIRGSGGKILGETVYNIESQSNKFNLSTILIAVILSLFVLIALYFIILKKRTSSKIGMVVFLSFFLLGPLVVKADTVIVDLERGNPSMGKVIFNVSYPDQTYQPGDVVPINAYMKQNLSVRTANLTNGIECYTTNVGYPGTNNECWSGTGNYTAGSKYFIAPTLKISAYADGSGMSNIFSSKLQSYAYSGGYQIRMNGDYSGTFNYKLPTDPRIYPIDKLYFALATQRVLPTTTYFMRQTIPGISLVNATSSILEMPIKVELPVPTKDATHSGTDVGLRIKRSGKIYPVAVVPVGDKDASPMRIKAQGKEWALMKFNPAE